MPSTAVSMLDGVSTSVAVKAPCVDVELANITLSGLQGYTEGDRVLVVGQTDATENGIYLASSGQWQRAPDADGNRDLVNGTLVMIQGSSGIGYQVTTADPIVIGTSELDFEARDVDDALRGELASTSATEGAANIAYQRSETGAAAIHTRSKLLEIMSLTDFGAVGDDSTNNGTAIANAIAAAQSSGSGRARILIPKGIFQFAIGQVFDEQIYGVEFVGEHHTQSVLKAVGNIIPITITDYAMPLLANFTLDHTGSGTNPGIKAYGVAGNEFRIRDCIITNQTSHGIELIDCIQAIIADILLLTNAGDGLKLNGGAVTSVADANSFGHIDTRGNTGWGFNCESGWANKGGLIVAQSNIAGGVRMGPNARQNKFTVYAESNVGPQVEFVSNNDCKGNRLTVLEGAVTMGALAADRNMVLHMKRGAVFDPNYNKVTADKFILQSALQDGTAVTGTLTFDHTSANRYDLTASNGGAAALIHLSNGAGTANFTLTGRYYIGTPTEIANGTAPSVNRGTGSPEGALSAMVGSIYMRTDGGAATCLYVKEGGGGGGTGWVAK